MSTPNQSNSASTAKLLAEDRSLLTTLTVIWSGLFVLGVLMGNVPPDPKVLIYRRVIRTSRICLWHLKHSIEMSR